MVDRPWTLFLLALHQNGGWAMHSIEFETRELAQHFADQWPKEPGWRAIVGPTTKEAANGSPTA